MKVCIRCKENKPAREFYRHSRMKDGRINKCIGCTKIDSNENNYDFTEKGVVRVIYKTQKRSSKVRGHKPPSYSKEDFSKWLYRGGFKEMYDLWVKSDYRKDLKPSVDRVDDLKGYTFSNIRLGSWKDNREHQYSDIRLGIGSSGRRCKKVYQYDLDGNLLKCFFSQKEAERITGISNKAISLNVLGKTKISGGFVWSSCLIEG